MAAPAAAFLAMAAAAQGTNAAQPTATPAPNGTPGQSRQIVSHTERRPVPIDIAPVSAEAPVWRLDDTRTLVAVGLNGPRMAAVRAVDLYRELIDRRAGLAAIRPGEGFVTWHGSPLWLSLAAIAKPAALGVLPGASPPGFVPGFVNVFRTDHGEWLVEHAGGPWRAPQAARHAATAADDEALLRHILYGITTEAPETAMFHRFEAAHAATRFAGIMGGAAGLRAQEAWAMVARVCAAAVLQPNEAAPAAETWVMQAALSAVVDGHIAALETDPLAIAPLARDRFIAIALSGDPARVAAGLRGLGRSILGQVRQGQIDRIDPIEALALAVCLGRLTREIADLPRRPSAPRPAPSGSA